ncbi:glycosyltransferase family 4 protein [Paenibacillus allorhizosphaerae]|uniref:Spore coat protein SA n=1 Tax=Paenibacillus allorhizosphaerae TaxID=2849866 RepID=A0ABN7TFQ3_9BACL|nr:glycosyltransferase family 4 protein [Paenibacillus allorhizosphaerae]CAG7624576.1 Spore coat protein SA [Paenibacillus allorhizosphaerae]
MRLLMVAPEQFPVPGGGSVEICMLAIAKKLAKQHHVTIVSRQKGGSQTISRIGHNLTIVRVPSGSSNRYISSVLRFMKGRKYDLIQVDNRPYFMAQIKRAFPRTPVSLFLHSLTFVPRTKSINACLHKADLIIANSNSLQHNLNKLFPAQRHKIRTVHLGVDTERFKPSGRRPSKRSCVILFVGRVIPRKGVPVLIKAVRKVRKQWGSATLLVAGKGKRAYLGELKRQARKQNVPVKFLGNIPHNKIHRVYRLADCFVCPSQEHEAFGLVNVEAMASGIPVIASNIGGIKEIVKHGHNGYLVAKYKKAKAFAQYIVKIAKNRSLQARLGRNGRMTVKRNFSWGNTASKLSVIYLRRAMK